MPIQALRHTGNVVAEGRPKNWREGIARLYPNGSASLTAFLAFLDAEPTSDPEFSWWEKKLPTLTVFINNAAGYAANATTFTVDDGAGGDPGKILRAGYLLKNLRTGEQMRVAADQTSGTSVTVERGFGEIAAAAINDNDELRVIGQANAEGASVPTATQYDPVKKFNYCQIFRSSLAITRTAKKTRLRTEDNWRQAMIEALELISMDMEWAFFFSQRKETTDSGGNPIRTTRGLVRWVEADAPANDLTIADGSMSEAELVDQLEIIFRYGSTEKIAFCGSTAMNVLTKLAKVGTTQFTDAGDEIDYGIRVRRFRTAFGDLLLRQHSLFNLYDNYRKMIVICDIEKIRYRYIDDLDFYGDRQSPGDDKKVAEFLAECGLEVHFPETHGVIRNVATAA